MREDAAGRHSLRFPRFSARFLQSIGREIGNQAFFVDPEAVFGDRVIAEKMVDVVGRSMRSIDRRMIFP
jgi:hypothetical protein